VPERETTPTLPRVKMVPGMMPILHSPAVMTPGQFGPIRVDFRALQRFFDTRHVKDRNAFGDANDERRSSASMASQIASAGAGGGT